MKKAEIQWVVFDLDGTLVDTELTAARVVKQWFTQHSIRVDAEDASLITGVMWSTAAKLLHQKYHLKLPLAEFERELVTSYRNAIQNEVDEVPGAAAFVRSLHAAGIPIGLVSGSARLEILHCLSELGITDLFHVILGCEDYPRSKPAPDGYLKAFGMMNAKPESTLIFEDSSAGVTSGLSAGARVCVIQSTNHFGQSTAGAHWAIPDFRGKSADWLKSL